MKDPPSYLCPRMCKLVRTSAETGFGFILHTTFKGANIVGDVTPNSIAYFAGLQKFDRVLAVNNQNCIDSNHTEVTVLITQIPVRVELIVISEDGYKYFTENQLDLSPNSRYIIPGEIRQEKTIAISSRDNSVTLPVKSSNATVSESVVVSNKVPQVTKDVNGARPFSVGPEYAVEKRVDLSPANRYKRDHTVSEAPSSYRQSSLNKDGNEQSKSRLPGEGLSAAEMRARLSKCKRVTVKQDPSTFTQKHEAFQSF